MPIFEYHCPACGKDFELIVKNSASTPECPDCGAKELKRKFSSFAVASGNSKSKCRASDSAPCPHGGCGCGSGCCHSR